MFLHEQEIIHMDLKVCWGGEGAGQSWTSGPRAGRDVDPRPLGPGRRTGLSIMDTTGTQLAVLYTGPRPRAVAPTRCSTQLYVVGTADSVLIREVPFIQSVLYREVPL